MNDKLREVFAEIRNTSMAEWVGVGDPEQIASALFGFVDKHVGLHEDMRILDLGCGVGRSSAPFADYLNSKGRLVGVDVVESMIDFCKRVIGSRYQNAHFFACGTPDSYLRAAQSANLKALPSVEDVLNAEGPFDLVLAFSVFTHLLPEEMESYFALFDRIVAPDGRLVLTFYFLDQWTRTAIKTRMIPQLLAPDTPGDIPELGRVYFASPSNPRSAVAIDLDDALHMAEPHGFQPDRVVFGQWRGLRSETGQDALILQRSRERRLPSDFEPQRYLDLNPDVAAARVDPVQHFLTYGSREARAYK